MSAEAMSALSVWASPSPLDRVDGAYLGPVPQRDPIAVREARRVLQTLDISKR